LTNFLLAWWPLFLLIQLPWIATRVAHLAYTRTNSRLDHATPDVLPETAGLWLERQIVALGLRVRSIVTDSRARRSTNAFHPIERTIMLTQNVYFKRDPVYWAVAAHELGHAQFRIGWPRLTSLFTWCETVETLLVSLGLALGLGNMPYGLPYVTDVAFILLALALALHVLEIVEEMIASAIAFTALRREPTLTPADLRNVRVVLALALSTYLASFVGHAVLLGAWSLIEHNTSHGGVELSTLTTLGHTMAIVWSLVVGVMAVTSVLDIRGRSSQVVNLTVTVAAVLSMVAIPSLMWLLWDARPGAGFAWCVMLAAVPAIRMITAIASAVFAIPFRIVRRFFREALRGIEGPGVERSAAYIADLKAGEKLTAAGNAEVARMFERAGATGSTVLSRVIAALTLPLLVVYWIL
jgi:Zn-dependent membrane protease YugP